MKSIARGICCLTLLTLITSCGKDNESGKKNNPIGNPYQNPYFGNQYGVLTSPYASGGISVNEVINRNPCMTMGTPTQNRVQAQQPVTLQNVLPVNDVHVGVTSHGDVAVLVGQGSKQALFITYICQRPHTYNNSGQVQIMDLAYGSYSQCAFSPITRATVTLPGAPTPLYFRWLDGGRSTGGPFGPPVCQN